MMMAMREPPCAHVLAEPGDIVAQVSREMKRVGEQLFEIVARGIVKRETRRPAKLRLEILQAATLKLSLPGEYPLLSIGQHTIETAEHRQRENDILVMAAPESIADEVSDSPHKADNLAMVHWPRSSPRRRSLQEVEALAPPPAPPLGLVFIC
jgi:hypothetical protein